MFYQCPQCQRTWQHPITKCPYCFIELHRISEGKKATVIGVSRVEIPTVLHPKVPYFVLALEDKNKNRWTQKSVKEYQIGEIFETEGTSGKQAVAVWRSKYDNQEALERVINLICPTGLSIGPSSKILLLPTLALPQHPYFRTNTSPQFLEAALKYLINMGASVNNIKVAAQSFTDFPIESSAQKSQLLRMCQGYKITPLDLSQSQFIKKEIGGISFEISQEAFQNHIIINLPILSLNKETKVEGPLLNILKFLRKESLINHRKDKSQTDIALGLCEGLPDIFTIAEAISIRKSNDYTAFLGLVLASYNLLNLERIFAEITMRNDLPACLKNIKIQDIPLAGRQIEELQYDIEQFY